MDNILKYKGYHSHIEIGFDDHIFYGKIEGIRDFVNFMCDIDEGVSGIIREFHSAVDDYISCCLDVGKLPDLEDKKVAEYA